MFADGRIAPGPALFSVLITRMILVKEKLGDADTAGKEQDLLPLQWYETSKRIMHKTTVHGREINMRFLAQDPQLTQNSLVFDDDHLQVRVDILPCEVICIVPGTMHALAAICYEIGNKHLPLFFHDEELLVPFDAPLFRQLLAAGYKAEKKIMKLLQPLRTTVQPHGTESLFTKILKRTSERQ